LPLLTLLSSILPLLIAIDTLQHLSTALINLKLLLAVKKTKSLFEKVRRRRTRTRTTTTIKKSLLELLFAVKKFTLDLPKKEFS